MTRKAVTSELARSELRLLRSEGTGRWIALIMLIALTMAIANGLAWHKRQGEIVRVAQTEEASRIALQLTNLEKMAQGEYSPSSAFTNPANAYWIGHRHAARYAFLPPKALGWFAIGHSDLQPPYIKVSGETKESFALNDEIENPASLLTGRFDLSFFVVFIAPLLVIALTYNILALEREQGRLSMLLATSVPLGQVVLAKAGVRLALVLLPMVVVTGAVLSMQPQASFGEFVVWSTATMAYLGFWVLLACALNLMRTSSSMNAVALVGAWLVLAVIIPSAVSTSIHAMYPVPSRAQMINQVRAIQTELSDSYSAQSASFSIEHGMDSAEQGVLSKRDYLIARKRLWVQEQAGLRIEALMQSYQDQIDRRQNQVADWQFASPVLVAYEGFNRLAGTHPSRYREFIAQVDDFHRQWRGFFAPKVLNNIALQAQDYDQFPHFSFQEPTRDALAQVSIFLIGVLAPGLVLFGLIRLQIRRFYLQP